MTGTDKRRDTGAASSSQPAERLKKYWDDDATGYDDSPGHHPRTRYELAAWRAALVGLLPPPPSTVLDVGAGTGFLSLLVAGLGHDVTALDASPRMLEQLRRKATGAGVAVTTVLGDATSTLQQSSDAGEQPRFDVVISRHLLWTLPDPVGALRAWREASAVGGRLVLVEALWGNGASRRDRARQRAHRVLSRLRGHDPAHHAELPSDLRAELPLGQGPTLDELLDAVARAGWSSPRVHRLRDVELAMAASLQTPERLVGVSTRLAVVADNARS